MGKLSILFINLLIFISFNSYGAEIDPFEDGEEHLKAVGNNSRYSEIGALNVMTVIFGSESGGKWTKFEKAIAPYFYKCKLIELVEFLKKNKKQKNKECRNLLFEIFRDFKNREKKITYFDYCVGIMSVFKNDQIDDIKIEEVQKAEKEFVEQVTKFYEEKNKQ